MHIFQALTVALLVSLVDSNPDVSDRHACRAICDADVSDRHVSGRLDGSVYRTLSSMGKIKCAEHCLRSSNCLSVNYKRLHLTCEINTRSDKNALTPDTSWVYLDKGDLLQVWDNQTCAVQCPPRHTRVDLTSGKHICVRTECGEPLEVPNAAVSTHKVGVSEKTVYTCNTHYQFTGSGNGQLTCKADGTFADVHFACTAIPCPRPPTVSHAYLQSYKNNVGAKARYECKFGYGTFQSKVIACKLGGYWSSVKFQCKFLGIG